MMKLEGARTHQTPTEDGGAILNPGAPSARFSPRETDCLVLLVQGFTDDEIGQRMAISHATVRFHLDSARQKARARSRTHLAALAVAWGVASP
jgi:DNA-binding CsgD family transcriptional regulator